ncbi:MAG: hypothetical protein IKG42_07135 [Clostridia bacterium]|nr:hypothetical protein [Clostridia bacterium]
MTQVITDEIQCICGYTHVVREFYPIPLFPNDYIRPDGKKAIFNEDGFFSISLLERKKQKMRASLELLQESREESLGGKPFESIIIDPDKCIVLCICPECGVVFSRSKRCKITVSNVHD